MSKLTARESRLLARLTDEWVRPMDIGGTDASHHSATLRSLARKGFAERRRRNSLMNALGSSRGSYEYRRAESAVCKAPVGFDGDETCSEIEWCGNELPCAAHDFGWAGMSKFKGASGPHFLLCPKLRRVSFEQRRYQSHELTKTGRVRHRPNPYGRRHQDEYRCSCGHVFWSNYGWSKCARRPGSLPGATCP